MKKIVVLLSSFLLISLMGNTQAITPDKVPAPVKQAFTKKFPAATDVKYEMEKKDYEVTFKDKGASMSANYDATGKWLETETEIKESDLPKEITALIFVISSIPRFSFPCCIVSSPWPDYQILRNKLVRCA